MAKRKFCIFFFLSVKKKRVTSRYCDVTLGASVLKGKRQKRSPTSKWCLPDNLTRLRRGVTISNSKIRTNQALCLFIGQKKPEEQRTEKKNNNKQLIFHAVCYASDHSILIFICLCNALNAWLICSVIFGTTSSRREAKKTRLESSAARKWMTTKYLLLLREEGPPLAFLPHTSFSRIITLTRESI